MLWCGGLAAPRPSGVFMRSVSILSSVGAVLMLAGPLDSQQPAGAPAPRPAGRGPGGRGTPIQPGESCPPGTTEIRPRSCLGPEAPAPSILDYRPRSTLVTPVHLVRRAKYPAIDFHGHPQARR